MPLSSFQQPSTRRDSLEYLIQAAASDGDLHRLNVLRSQWVHRYGLASLPALALSDGSQNHSETSVVALESVEPVTSLEDYRAQQESNELNPEELVQAAGGAAQDDSMRSETDEQDALPFETTSFESTSFQSASFESPSDRDHAVQPESDQAQSLSIDPDQEIPSSIPTLSSRRAATPPPLSTPRSLRRWLPGADGALPQAS